MNEGLQAVLEEPQYQLLTLTRRQFALEAFNAELERVTRGKEFRIWNDILWLMLLDSRDMLVIHLASWAKSVYEPGGLIGRLQANYARELPRQRPWTSGLEREDKDAHLREYQDRFHSDAFKRLFTCMCEPFPTAAAFAAMRDKFVSRMRPVLDDRSQNRAHPYERAHAKASAKMLDFTELRDVITFAEDFVNDLRIVGCGSKLPHNDMNATSSEHTAEEFVDALLLGTQYRRDLVRGETQRDGFYERLHMDHEARSDAARILFNDNWPG
jgi:hypothetical protein